MKNPPILLVQPPFLRLFGSHNDRMPLELCYASAALLKQGWDNVVFNADWTGATRYVRWATLFDNFSYFGEAAEGRSPLITETVERVLSFGAEVVVLAAGDNTLGWVDLGNAYVAAAISRELRRYGAYTVGVGPFYTSVPEKFLGDFDAIIKGYAWTSIADVVERRPRGEVVDPGGSPIVPLNPTTTVYPGCIDDFVLTALGCPYSCNFCFARTHAYLRMPIEVVVSDLESRVAREIDIADSIFPVNLRWLSKLGRHLREAEKRFSCELHSRLVDEERLALLVDIGVTRVKMGLEMGDDGALSRLNKTQRVADIRSAVRLIKDSGLKLVLYVLLGGPGFSVEEAQRTYDICLELQADDYVINTWAYYDLAGRDFRYDCHFSQRLVDEWRLGTIMEKFFQLQSPAKAGLGQLL